MSSLIDAWLLVGLILANAYCLGANCVERFVNYQTWSHIDVESFRAYHRAQAPFIRWFVVLPIGISTVLQFALLFFYKEAAIDGRLVWTMLVASIAGSASTAFLQLPIHQKFNQDGYSDRLMRQLLSTDWIRKLTDVVRFLATALLLKHLIWL